MAQTTLRFYGPLNDFLPRSQRRKPFSNPFIHRVSVKDMIESLGVPHPEVDLLLVNSEPAPFSYLVQDGDFISVYPAFYSLAMAPFSLVRPKPLTENRFVLDVHLGKLATSLRMLGFDTLYRNDYGDEELARISAEQDRILLTRDRGLLMRGLVDYGYYVRHTDSQLQLKEVAARF